MPTYRPAVHATGDTTVASLRYGLTNNLDPRGLESAGQALIDYFDSRFKGTKTKPVRADWNHAAAAVINAYFEIPVEQEQEVAA